MHDEYRYITRRNHYSDTSSGTTSEQVRKFEDFPNFIVEKEDGLNLVINLKLHNTDEVSSSPNHELKDSSSDSALPASKSDCMFSQKYINRSMSLQDQLNNDGKSCQGTFQPMNSQLMHFVQESGRVDSQNNEIRKWNDKNSVGVISMSDSTDKYSDCLSLQNGKLRYSESSDVSTFCTPIEWNEINGSESNRIISSTKTMRNDSGIYEDWSEQWTEFSKSSSLPVELNYSEPVFKNYHSHENLFQNRSNIPVNQYGASRFNCLRCCKPKKFKRPFVHGYHSTLSCTPQYLIQRRWRHGSERTSSTFSCCSNSVLDDKLDCFKSRYSLRRPFSCDTNEEFCLNFKNSQYNGSTPNFNTLFGDASTTVSTNYSNTYTQSEINYGEPRSGSVLKRKSTISEINFHKLIDSLQNVDMNRKQKTLDSISNSHVYTVSSEKSFFQLNNILDTHVVEEEKVTTNIENTFSSWKFSEVESQSQITESNTTDSNITNVLNSTEFRDEVVNILEDFLKDNLLINSMTSDLYNVYIIPEDDSILCNSAMLRLLTSHSSDISFKSSNSDRNHKNSRKRMILSDQKNLNDMLHSHHRTKRNVVACHISASLPSFNLKFKSSFCQDLHDKNDSSNSSKTTFYNTSSTPRYKRVETPFEDKTYGFQFKNHKNNTQPRTSDKMQKKRKEPKCKCKKRDLLADLDEFKQVLTEVEYRQNALIEMLSSDPCGLLFTQTSKL